MNSPQLPTNVRSISPEEYFTELGEPVALADQGSRFLPDSRGQWEPLRIWEMAEPSPLRFVLAGLLPEGFAASLFGDGAVGKSYIALGLAMHVITGRPLFGREVMRGPVLYIDAELNDTEFRRRAYRIARGMGLTAPPEGLFYMQPRGSLAREETFKQCSNAIASIRPVLVILDSYTVAAYGADPNAASDVTDLMQRIAGWGTSLLIDHIPKPAPGANLANARQFGSAFKFNLARSSISVVRADGGAVTLRQSKSNFGPLAEPIYVALNFEGNAVRLEMIRPDDERLAGAENHATPQESVLFALQDKGSAGATPAEIAEALGIKEKTVRNYLSGLRKRGLAEPTGDGSRWRVPIPETSS